MSNFKYNKHVETLNDIEKEIEKEFAFLTWLEYMEEKDAEILARQKVYQQYPDIILKLKKEGKIN